jgi:hypothetical protein
MRATRDLTSLSDVEERSAVQGQLRRLFELVTQGRDSEGDHPLRLVELDPVTLKPCHPADDGTAAVSGDMVWFVDDGSWRSLTSPMAARLALLGCSDLVAEPS